MAERGSFDKAIEIANIPEKVGMFAGGAGVALAVVFGVPWLAVAATDLFVASAASHEITGSFHSGNK